MIASTRGIDMTAHISLAGLRDDAAFLSLEHQLHLTDVLGEHEWRVNFEVPSFSVTGDHPLTCTAVHLLGSAAPGPRSWLWSWANQSGYAPAATWLAEWLRGFGQEQGIAELTTAELPFAALPGAPDDPGAAAWALVEAAKAASGRWTSYTPDVGGGTRFAFLIEHPDFVLPPPEGLRVMRVLREGLLQGITDHRRAVQSYATGRGLEVAWMEGSAALSLPGLSLNIHFDALGRVSEITGALSAPESRADVSGR
jgi:hypothetical protein